METFRNANPLDIRPGDFLDTEDLAWTVEVEAVDLDGGGSPFVFVVTKEHGNVWIGRECKTLTITRVS